MTAPFGWDVPDEMVQAMRARLAEGEANQERRLQFISDVADMPGCLGELFRTIGAQYQGWEIADAMRCVTEGESMRMEAIIDAAIAAHGWLGGE